MIILQLTLAALPAYAVGLSEEQAVQRVLDQPRVATLLQARRGAAEGAADAVGRWENPEVEFSDESLKLPGDDASDRFLWVRQRFNVAGARGLERTAAQRRLEGELARIELERRALVREVRGLYYDVLAARQHLEAQEHWYQRLNDLADAVDARLQKGDAARYDAVRLRQELALVRARVVEGRAELASAREALFDLIGADPAELTGGLLPPEAPAAGADSIENHPTLRALRAEASGADAHAKAARRDAWPDVTVGIGRREYDEGEISADGGLIAIGIEVPLFNRHQGEFRAADNEAAALRSEASLTRSRLQAQLAESRRLVAARRDAVLDLKRNAAGEGQPLTAMAEAAYAAGEIDVMALIDAHRTELATASEITTLSRAARAAYIDLQYLSEDP
jgi:outer membrane protein TolC